MTTDRLTVSVVLCTHNGMKFLQAQLESILNQSYLPHEIIISDDNSSDGTVAFAKTFLASEILKRPSLRQINLEYIQNTPALGVTLNFQNALQRASGDLIALSDQDDIWLSGRLEQIVSEFQADPQLVLVHSDAVLVDELDQELNCGLFEALRVSDREKTLINSGQGEQVLLRRNIVTGATTVIRKSLLYAALPFPAEFLHDEWLALVAVDFGKVKLLESQLIRYRQHGNNQVGVRKLGIRHAVGRMVFPRTERNQILLRRTEALSQHPYFSQITNESVRATVAEKLLHEQVRTSYPASRIKRFPPVLKELNSGRYSKYGLGMQDVIRDLIQPV